MDQRSTVSFIHAETRFAKLDSRALAFRELGTGTPILLANRFRGNLDSWDPAFIDALARRHRVIVFEYAGTGRSTGSQASSHSEMASDLLDLADFLELESYAIGGWSLGGMVAQVALTERPQRVTHGVLIGTRAPVAEATPLGAVFLEHALKPVNDLADETILFFNPRYEDSRNAAEASWKRTRARTSDRSPELTREQWMKTIQIRDFATDRYGTFQKIRATNIPLLVVLGEDDISFPAEDWLKLKGQLPTAQMLLLPRTGHAPHHQFPELAAGYIAAFLAAS